VTTLDVCPETARLERADLIKIDVEGAELAVLRGAARFLAAKQPYLIVEASEWSSAFGYRPQALTAFLEARGYRVLAIDREDPLSSAADLDGSDHTNLLGVPPRFADRISHLLLVVAEARRLAGRQGDE
jgi:hypothetical protein